MTDTPTATATDERSDGHADADGDAVEHADGDADRHADGDQYTVPTSTPTPTDTPTATPTDTPTPTATPTPTNTPITGGAGGFVRGRGNPSSGQQKDPQPIISQSASARRFETRVLLPVLLLAAGCFGMLWRRTRRTGFSRWRRSVGRPALVLPLIALAMASVPIIGWAQDRVSASGGAVVYADPLTANLFVGGPPLLMDERVVGIPSDRGVAAFELDLRFDPNLVAVTIEEGGFLSGTGNAVSCDVTSINFFERVFSCTSSGAEPYPTGGGVLARLTIVPSPDLRLRATMDNGGITLIDLVSGGTTLVDSDGFFVPIQRIIDGVVVVRQLEGDINEDCVVNVIDEQDVAQRYTATFGSLLYTRLHGREPGGGDGEVDIKDLQFVVGRDGSKCDEPTPPQPTPTPVETPVLPTPTTPSATASATPTTAATATQTPTATGTALVATSTPVSPTTTGTPSTATRTATRTPAPTTATRTPSPMAIVTLPPTRTPAAPTATGTPSTRTPSPTAVATFTPTRTPASPSVTGTPPTATTATRTPS